LDVPAQHICAYLEVQVTTSSQEREACLLNELLCTFLADTSAISGLVLSKTLSGSGSMVLAYCNSNGECDILGGHFRMPHSICIHSWLRSDWRSHLGITSPSLFLAEITLDVQAQHICAYLEVQVTISNQEREACLLNELLCTFLADTSAISGLVLSKTLNGSGSMVLAHCNSSGECDHTWGSLPNATFGFSLLCREESCIQH